MKNKTPPPAPRQFCRDCSRITDRFNEGFDGKMIFGRCPKKEHAVLLNHDSCEEFK